MAEILRTLLEKSHAENGYQELPGGLIIQWGKKDGINSAAGVNVNFNKPFQQACYAVVATHVSPGDSPANRNVEVVIRGLTYFDAYGNSTSNSIYWIAIGK